MIQVNWSSFKYLNKFIIFSYFYYSVKIVKRNRIAWLTCYSISASHAVRSLLRLLGVAFIAKLLVLPPLQLPLLLARVIVIIIKQHVVSVTVAFSGSSPAAQLLYICLLPSPPSSPRPAWSPPCPAHSPHMYFTLLHFFACCHFHFQFSSLHTTHSLLHCFTVVLQLFCIFQFCAKI